MAARITHLVLGVVLLGAMATTVQAQKVGHIDKQQLLLQMPQRADIENRIRTKAQELEQRIAAMKAELESTVTKVQGELATMTETEKAMAERDVQQLAERIEGARQQARTDLDALQGELLAPVLAQIDSAITAVASEGGFAYVLDTGSGVVLFQEGGNDLMPAVRKKLGLATP